MRPIVMTFFSRADFWKERRVKGYDVNQVKTSDGLGTTWNEWKTEFLAYLLILFIVLQQIQLHF